MLAMFRRPVAEITVQIVVNPINDEPIFTATTLAVSGTEKMAGLLVRLLWSAHLPPARRQPPTKSLLRQPDSHSRSAIRRPSQQRAIWRLPVSCFRQPVN